MDQTTFDNLARLFATTRSRRQVLKGLIAGGAGGAVLAAGFTRSLQTAAAQSCTPDDGSCASDTECCSGSCDNSGYCYTPDDTCIEDGGLCQAGRYCCSGEDCAPGGHCPASECIEDDGTCSDDTECCSGNCDNSGYCFTPDYSCIEDGGLCQAGRYCCSGADCDTTGHCPISEVSVLPATGSGADGGQSSASGLVAPMVALGAAAVIGARRLRSTAQDDASA